MSERDDVLRATADNSILFQAFALPLHFNANLAIWFWLSEADAAAVSATVAATVDANTALS